MTDNLKAIDIAKAIEGADWSGVSIGNKAVLELAIKSLRSARNELTASAIEGAIAFGYQNTNPPPSDDHWLAPYWKIGRKHAELEGKNACINCGLSVDPHCGCSRAASRLTPEDTMTTYTDRQKACSDRVRHALPEFSQQDDYLLAHGASLMSESSHEIIHVDTLRKIVEAVLKPCEHEFMAFNRDAEICTKCEAVKNTSPVAGFSEATRGDDVLTWLETEVTAVSCRYHGDPNYDHDAYWMKDKVLKLISDARKAFPSQPAAPADDSMTLDDAARQYKDGVHIGSGLPFATCPCGLCAKVRSIGAAPSTAAQGATLTEREQFETKFQAPAGVEWNGVTYVVREGHENSYRCDRFVGQWDAWRARSLAPTPVADSGASDDNETACSSCGLTMGQSRALAAAKSVSDSGCAILKVLPHHSIHFVGAVTIFGDPAHVLSARAAIEAAKPVSVDTLDVNALMVEAGWQNSAIRMADLPQVRRVVELAFSRAKPVIGVTEQSIVDAVREWFPDRAYQAPFFARALLGTPPTESTGTL